MGVAYSQDLRDRILKARDEGMPTAQVARVFHVSTAWVRRVMQRRREKGQISPLPRGGATVIKIDLHKLRQLVAQQPDATTRELHQRLGVVCSLSAVDMALRRMGLSFKKRRCMPPSRIDPTWLNDAGSGEAINPAATHSD